MSRTPEEEKHTEVKKVIGGVEYIKCSVCFNFFRTEDLNRHLWSHAWTKYESLPARKQSGRFKQLMKFVSKQYKVRATNSNSRDLEEIHQRKLFYEKYPRDSDVQSSVKASPVASSTKSTPTSETRSNEITSASENISDSKYLEENLDDSKETSDFDLPPLEEIPKLPERLLDTTLDNSSTKSENSGIENDLEIRAKPEELLVDSAESLDLGPSELTWNSWEEKLDSVQQEKVQEKPPQIPVVENNDAQKQQNVEKPEELEDQIEEMVEPEKETDEQMKVETTPETTKMDCPNVQSDEIQSVVEVEEHVNPKQAAEPPSLSGKDIREFSDEDNELMIDENFGAGQEFLKFRNRSLDNDDSAASGPISDILENAAALSGVSPESETKTEITNDFEIEKVETMDECIEISDEDDDEPITKLIQSNNKKPQTDREKLDVANGFIAQNMEKISSRVSKPMVPSGSAGPSVTQPGAQFLPYQNPTPPNSAVIRKPARIDPHFDGRSAQMGGRVQTVGRFEKVTKSRSLDRSKNRSADRWSQEDFEKTNRMAMRESQRPRNKSLPINSNESNNRTDQRTVQQTTRQSPVIHPVTPREVNSNQTQPSPKLTVKDFILYRNGLHPENDVIDVGSVQDHFDLVSKGISNNNSKEQIILIQSTDENVDVTTNGWQGIVKNPVARNQLTLTPGNSPEGSMMGPEENHSSRKISHTGKRDFDVIEINDSSDENSPQKRARIQIRNSNDHHARASYHSATDQPVIATSVQPHTYYTQAGTSNSTLPKYTQQQLYNYHAHNDKHRRTSNGSTGSYSSDPKRQSSSSQLGHRTTVGSNHQQINVTGQSAFDLELQGQHQIQQHLQDALMTQTIRAMMGGAVPPPTRQPPTQNIRPVQYQMGPIANPLPSPAIQQFSMAQLQQMQHNASYMSNLAMSQHQPANQQQRSHPRQRATTTMRVSGPGINMDQQAFNDFLTNREGYRRQ